MLPSLTTIFAVFLVATVVRGGEDGNTEGGSSDPLPKYPYTDLLKFTDRDYKEAFKSLDSNNDNVIKFDDLKSHYYHKDSEHAIKKFMELLDTPDPNSKDSIDFEEFKSFMNRDQVKRIAISATSLASSEYRQLMFADAILSYVYLVLDKHAIRKLFDSLQSNKDEQLDQNEVKGMEVKLMNGDKQHELTDAQVTVIMAEMGGSSGAVSFKDFENYLQDWNLGLIFRECRTKLNNGVADYDNICLVRKLIRYTTRSLTEYVITLLFHSLITTSKDRKLRTQEVKIAYTCDYKQAEHFISYSEGAYGVLEYGDFRFTVTLPLLKDFYESECSGEKETNIQLMERIKCIKMKLWELANEDFYPKYIGIPDFDLVMLFEDLDTTNDGRIEQKQDLEDGKRWQSELARKFFEEVGHPDTKENVNLNDFMSYMYNSFMMTAVAECQLEKDKMTCYNRELEDMITHVLTDSEVDDFFRFYTNRKQSSSTTDKNKKTTNEIITGPSLRDMYPEMPDEVIDNFLAELGMGDRYVHPIEFKYYVKQQDPSHVFSIDDKSVPRKHFAVDQLHDKLIFYIGKFMTENDIISLFVDLDMNGNRIIENSDVARQEDILDADLLSKMAVHGNKEHATFHEFWLFLNSKASGSEETRKRLLEKACTQTNQKKEIKCFASKLKSVK